MTHRVVWGVDESAAVMSVDDLDELLDRLTAKAAGEKPFLVQLEVGNGDSLSLGLGRDRSVLHYVSGSADPPYYASIGDPGADPDSSIVFHYNGEWSEFPTRHAVPLSKAREALRRFHRTQALPDNIEWEEC